MSKNVAVFVDVANIFYAAKAAGVDIDYVTLLKSATAGRDFVRAYAYTGLDPENENQRQFHSFLARSGYKVVSKDIRKYGDGRIKANLDIELVVDMMRMAEHLDIAVVVSGDGDFAPAIRAVQQMGVRVEVISFRGNTSSDLIDVADVFIDIGHVARVEKGERSGRRVAAEGDLSMTEVPDKEAGVTQRRRRGRRGETDEAPARPPRSATAPDRPAAAGAGLVALPGERLSRAAEAPAPDATLDEAVGAREPSGAAEGAEPGSGDRRRRRRGGRGRGRGGRGGDQPLTAPAEVVAEGELVDAALLADEIPTLPQHSTFGSVWDSQIGMPVATGPSVRTPAASSARVEDVEGLDDEPEVPEYLLSERRQQGRRPGGRGRGGRQSGGYRSAIDRERYGAAGPSGGYQGGGRASSGPRPAGPSRRAPEPPPAPQRSAPGPRPAAAAEPWSEVPPEVQELLRAEVARRQSGTTAPPSPGENAGTTRTDQVSAVGQPEPEAPSPRPTRTTRRRATTATTATADESGSATDEAKPRRTTRRKATPAPETEQAAAEAGEAPEAKPRRTTRRKATPAAETDAAAG